MNNHIKFSLQLSYLLANDINAVFELLFLT